MLRWALPFAYQPVPAGFRLCNWWLGQCEFQFVFVEFGSAVQEVSCQPPKQAGNTVELVFSTYLSCFQAFMNGSIEMLQQCLLGFGHASVDRFFQLLLQVVECLLDFFSRSAGVVYGRNAPFDIGAGFQAAKDSIGGAEKTVKEFELVL